MLRISVFLMASVFVLPIASQAEIPLVSNTAKPTQQHLQLAEAPTGNRSLTALPDEERMVYIKKRRKPLTVLYKSIFRALEHNGYFVLIEPNIGKNLSHFAQRWGTDYNKNKLEEIRSIVFCNAWYANKVSNADPYMLALCPLHITLYQKGDMTTIVFVRPGKVAAQSPAREVAEELEKDVIRIIENAV